MDNKIEKILFESESLNRYVILEIRFPKNYMNLNKPCDVIYAHDGQNLFNDKDAYFGVSWGFNETLNTLEDEGYNPTIVVGFYCNGENYGIERYREYSYFDCDDLLLESSFYNKQNIVNVKKNVLRAKGDLHINFLINELIPYIEKCYNVSENRSIIGSSMGGISSTVIGLLHQDKFKNAYCMSNAYWYSEKPLIDLINNTKKEHDINFYLDVGDNELSSNLPDDEIKKAYVTSNTNVNNCLKENGYNTIFKIIKNGEHNELSWKNRLRSILLTFK